MNLLPERLNERLERLNALSRNSEQSPGGLPLPVDAPVREQEIDELVTLAHRIQSAPSLQVHPDFAWQLERRILIHKAALQRERSARGWSFPRLLHVHPLFGIALGLCLLLLVLGTGVLAVAAQVSNPDNPLYKVKGWEQHVQISLANSPGNQAELDLQFARDQLNMLANLAGPGQQGAYQQALTDMDQQMSTAIKAIHAVPAGTYHDRLASELATFQVDARHTLRGLLTQLAVLERLLTTTELGRLGDTVPLLRGVVIFLPAHPNGHASISISGQDIQPGAQLLVDGQLVVAHSSLPNGLNIFVAIWTGDQHPQSIGILNPDGTAAQTTTIMLQISNDHGNGNGEGSGNRNGNGGGKPGGTPPPSH
jgi:Domain of unknown function (DUF5667)